MSTEQTAYLATCGGMFAVGLLLTLAGAGLCKVLDADWPGLIIGLGLLCMIVGPVMLIGFPTESAS